MKFTFDQELEECIVCGSSDINYFTQDHKGIRIFKCNNCNMKFMNPQYTDQYLSDFYAEYQSKDFKHHRYGDEENPRFAKHQDNIQLIEEYINPGKFFSIGSGNGFDMKVARDRGWEVEGYEVDPDFTKELADKFSIKMYSGKFEDIDLPAETYDCVYMNHVIEHPKNPGEYLSKIREILKPGGILYIATPNIDSLSIKIKKTLDSLGLRKKKGSYYDTWQHLTYYNPHHFSNILSSKFGFETLHMSNDVKKIENGKVKNSWIDKYLFKSGFRIVLRKK
ncbi:class I SAM-dependent methyltransferase [Fulvivirga lutea]|uniref:Class I SAM-dependent methyltransferase n=1 Tax=Fulvivirga lutea TaxID=2810512 RepID=A0A974WJA9_9BACT|nr:class I SAM-dependent methyltransferase [Fulvivirga lutea]QSE96378.1 class I SAM-dependent methyltransferase [Fulvivirga lutea]